jgi:hypothetical protein
MSQYYTSVSGGSPSIPTTFTTDSGNATPAANVLTVSGGEGIDTSGSGSTVTISGEDASDTNKGIASFTAADFDVASGDVSLEDTVVKTVAGDSGTATPSSHSFTVTGGTGVTTTGSGSTITIDAAATTPLSFPTDSGTATPAANALTIAGGEGIDVSGSGSTVTIAGEDATTANKGIASFATADFGVSSGAVDLNDAVVKSVATDSGTVTPSSHSFTVTGSGGISTSGSSATVTISASGITDWAEETTTSRSMTANQGVIANNAALVTLTIPDTAAVGDIIKVAGKGAGLWKLAQNAGDTIHFGDTDTTTGAGGSITATNQYDCIELLCITANTDFIVLSSVGNFTLV